MMNKFNNDMYLLSTCLGGRRLVTTRTRGHHAKRCSDVR